MPYVADLHIHSKYSLATSGDMNIPELARWAKIKGIGMLGTGDFTHPLWFKHIKTSLEEKARGTYCYDGVDFILSAEVSNIYRKYDKTRKVHNIIFADSFKTADDINRVLSKYGKLASDGRPILKLDCEEMVRIFSDIGPGIMVVPAHVWTPHFGMFGSSSGFDSPEECFGGELDKIFAIETGLSSGPDMNWRWSELDRFTLISNSDAHSPYRLAREANVFSAGVTYYELRAILMKQDRGDKKLMYTIEFFPEQGKYHWDGHRACKVSLSPDGALKTANVCPACGKRFTIGVMHRVEELSDRKEGFTPRGRPSFKKVAGLMDIIADIYDVSVSSKKVLREYFHIIDRTGSELNALLFCGEEELSRECSPEITKAIINTRKGRIDIKPGYDGEYGRVSVKS